MSERASLATPEMIEATLMALLVAAGAGKSVAPADVARAIAGSHPEQWSPLMAPVRRVVVDLMKRGRVTILRKGRPVDPDDFRGVYRIALAAGDGEAGAGKSALVRPASQ
jgi:hypothetical protein